MAAIKFTDVYVKNLKPVPGKQFEVSDQSGLILRVSPGGTKTWVYFYRFGGKTRRLCLGNYPKVSLSEARRLYAEVKEKKELGKDPALKDYDAKGTVKELADEFYTRYLLKQRTRPDIPKQILDADIVPALGDMKLVEVKPRDIIKALDPIVDRGAHTLANRALSIVKQMFSYGVSRGLLPLNPASEIKRSVIGGKEAPKDRALSLGEIRTLWLGLDDESLSRVSPQVKIGLKILLLTGVRTGEIRLAEWSHLDFDRDMWTVPAAITKTKITHKVPLSPLTKRLFKELHQHVGNTQYVMPSFTDESKPFTDKAICRAVDRMQDKIGIPYWTAHDLRRTFSTQLSAMGVAPHIVEKCLGHKLPKIMATYNQHEWLDERRGALNKWAEKIEILTGEKSNVVMLGARGEYGY
jgi:integrase